VETLESLAKALREVEGERQMVESTGKGMERKVVEKSAIPRRLAAMSAKAGL